jgi:hypothetical protein
MTSQSELRHIPEETLEQYCMGRLSESETEPLEEHLLLCTVCQDSLTETEQFLTVVRSAATQLEAEPLQESWWTKWWQSLTTLPKPVFAMAACALALLVILPSRTPNSAVVDLQAMRGAEAAIEAPSDAKLTLRLPAQARAAEGRLDLRIANAEGSIVAQAPVQKVDGRSFASVEKLKPGSYWVRLYSNENLMSEYGINVR